MLAPFGWMYGFGMEVRNLCYEVGVFKTHRLPVPVVSVGNLTVGGTGKTPLIVEIAEELRRRRSSVRIGILSRGYKGRPGSKWVVSDGLRIEMSVEEAGDEPVVLAKRLPGVKVFVGKDRVAVARKALTRFDLDLLILDDAFQHRRIHRDMDLLLIDGQRGFGNGRVLPAGPLREFPWNLSRASCVVVTHRKEGIPTNLRSWVPEKTPIYHATFEVTRIFEGVSGGEVPLDALRGKRLLGVCGIANPDSFKETLEGLGAKIQDLVVFPDHHAYVPPDFSPILERLKGKDEIVTTEKDWVKWHMKHPFRRVFVVAGVMRIHRAHELYDFMEKIVYNAKKCLKEDKG